MDIIKPEAIREWARGNQYDNYAPGDDGYCDPDAANWRLEKELPVSMLRHLMDDWVAWFQTEIEMDKSEGLCRGYERMLSEEIREEIVVLVRNGRGYIWDGWHRAAAVIVSGRAHVCAIVGEPALEPDHVSDLS